MSQMPSLLRQSKYSPVPSMVSFKAPVSVQGAIKIFEFNRNWFQNKLNENLNAVVRS